MQGTIQHRLLSKGLLFFLLIGIWSCENSDKIGLEITPPGERFAYHIDSSTVVKVSTLRQDSLTSEKRTKSLLGSMADPVFGKSRAGILTQLRLSSNDVDFGEDIQVDSTILILKYQSAYGDTTQIQHIRIHELQQDLFFDSTYYSNLDINNYYSGADPVAEFDYAPNPGQDSLHIRINKQLGEKILLSDDSHLADNTAFLEYFKGLYLESDPVDQGGSIVYFDLAGGNSRMILYYKNSEEDSLKYELVVNSNCTWVNTYEHDYLGSEVEAYINDTAIDAGKVYLQSMAGLRALTRFEFSDSLLQYGKEGISINKAELRIPVAQEYVTEGKPVSSYVQVFNALEDGTNDFISDIFLGEEYYGGFYDENTGEYTFNLARYVQDLMDPVEEFQLKNTGLFLVVKDSRISANQLVINNDPQGNKMSLVITYTVIN